MEDDETNPSQCLSDVVLDGLLGVLNYRRRGRCPFPSELLGTLHLQLTLADNRKLKAFANVPGV